MPSKQLYPKLCQKKVVWLSNYVHFKSLYSGYRVTSINVSVGIQSNTTCYSFSNGVYYTLSDMFRPFYNGHLQASILGGAVNTIVIRNIREPGSSVGIETCYGLDGPGIESRWGRDFSHTSRPALRPTQPPVQGVPSLSRG
jgi:hypothetical protein